MTVTARTIGASVLVGALLMTPATSQGQAAGEVFTATAVTKTASGASANAPVTIAIDRKMSQGEVDSLVVAFKTGGAAGLRKGFVGLPPTGSVRIGEGQVTPTRFTLERVTSVGRLLTILTDRPLLFIGGGAPDAKPREGYEFAVIDIEVDAKGNGSGTFAPAAKLKMTQGSLFVDDYGANLVRLTAVKKTQ
jgi:hypothetical protein